VDEASWEGRGNLDLRGRGRMEVGFKGEGLEWKGRLNEERQLGIL
jgi:hypothetical protein